MARGDWFRALQVPVLPVGAGAAIVGSLLGAAARARLNLLVFALVLVSLVVIQVAANLQKGIVESADLKAAAARPASAFVFDAGALGRTGMAPARARKLTLGLFAVGAAVGLLVVLVTGDAVLLVLGALGAFFAYSYSGPPLKLSYRGVGEVATFVAFGPLMVWGAYRAQAGGPVGFEFSRDGVLFMTWEVFWVGLAFGALAALISYARYFPAESEDREKGKQTPVVARGGRRAAGLYAALVVVGAGCFAAAWLHPTLDVCSDIAIFPPRAREAVELLFAAVATVVVGLLAFGALRSGDPSRVETAVIRTVGLHLLVTIVFVLGITATLSCRAWF